MDEAGGGAPRFRDLGAVALERDGVDATPGGAILTRLLARLLVDAGRRVEISELVEAVWGDRAGGRAVSTLESHLHRLRGFLEPGRGRGRPSRWLVAEGGKGYRLVVDPDRVDSVVFTRAAREATERLAAGDAPGAVGQAERARSLWRGRPYAPYTDEPWAEAAAAGLEERGRQLTETLVDGYLAAGRPEAALAELGPVIAEAPLRDRPWEQYLRATGAVGRIEDALAAYRRADRLFRDELGVEPGPGLQEIHRQLLGGGRTAPAAVASVAAVVPATPPEAARRPAPTVVLPPRRGRLVGRDTELAALVDRIPRHATTTLVGGAGCGKTTLAVAAAERLADRFPDGVRFVDLTSALDADQVGTAVTSTLGLAGGSAVEAVRSFVATRRMLLVLDNCEHVLDAVADLVEGLDLPDGATAVLATSREPLEVASEVRVDVVPLAVGQTSAPAVELFLERYAETGSDGRLGADDLVTASAICAAVDGVPLAIELAAARGRAFSLAEIHAQVREDPSALARVGRRGGHRGVRAAVDRSVRLLPAGERDLHAAMSAVPGPMTVATAAALVDAPRVEVQTALAGLVHRSLLVPAPITRPGGPSRFAQLAIVRGHGAHELGDVDAERVAERRDESVTRWIAARPRVGSPALRDFRESLDDDLPAVRATLQRSLVGMPSWRGPALAGALGNYWYYRGMLLEAARWVRLAFGHLALARPVDAAHLHAAAARGRLFAGDLDGAQPHLDALCAAVDELSGTDLLHVGDILVGTLWATIRLPADEVRRRLAGRLGEVAQRSGDPITTLQTRLVALAVSPDPDPALRLAAAEAVHTEAERVDNREIGWMVAILGGHAAEAAEDLDEALRWSRRGIGHHLALGSRQAQPEMEQHAVLCARRGDDAAAVRALAGARAQNERNGMRWPFLAESTTVLEGAARRLGAAVFDRAWRSGGDLTLVDLAAL
ncbi:AfsR/SARP family transcriptional regulator [Actinomycetospora soli]|uniref:AfsR/SARP family transcriptional regulator n=1 Tax=Actinomycetospora soli TaxID=2893887 RepID=UPI001E63B093|nr:BTAD domain-containing putative transcriptional regulator [Actinomycetospora soli]MCD2189382.1 winged helix-turn-helix domain-containing protein [Actinomycetospora soli]